MKTLPCLLMLILATAPSAHADNWLVNGDFSDGKGHWYGEGKLPADFAPSDPFTKADPFYEKGLVMPLSGALWKKICQDFKGHGGTGVVTVTYRTSPDFAFSAKPEDYQNMPDKIHYDAWKAFDSEVGSIVIFISDLESRSGAYVYLHPDPSQTGVQTFHAPLRELNPETPKTVTFAFPPGTGTIVLLSVDLENQ